MADRDRDPDGDDDLDVGDLRSVFASMRESDEEPSDNGLAALMAAARTKAEEMKPAPSWWERIAATLRRPAVLAFASVAILATGAVIVTRHQKDAPAPSVPSSEKSVAAPVVETKNEGAPVAAEGETAEAPAATLAEPVPSSVPKSPKRGSAPTTKNRRADRPVEDAPPQSPAPSLAGDAPADAASAKGDPALVARVKEAAKAGNCTEVKRLLALVGQRDKAAMDRASESDAAVRACL